MTMDRRLALRFQQQGDRDFEQELQNLDAGGTIPTRTGVNNSDSNMANGNIARNQSYTPGGPDAFNDDNVGKQRDMQNFFTGLEVPQPSSHLRSSHMQILPEIQSSASFDSVLNGGSESGSSTPATTQPLWSLYPTQISSVGNDRLSSPSLDQMNNSSRSQIERPAQIGRQESSSSTGRYHPGTPNEFLEFAGETHTQRESLLRHPSTHSAHSQHSQSSYEFNKAGGSREDGTSATTSLIDGYNSRSSIQMDQSRSSHQQSISSSVSSDNNMVSNLSTYLPVYQPRPVYSVHPQISQHSYTEKEFRGTEDPVTALRRRYKPKSSIPPDWSSSKYAEQCIQAAISSRLPPFSLHIDEYNILRSHLSYVHVTTYLNIRNGILRLWMSNPLVRVTKIEAAGCTREERFYALAEVAYEWLVRNGYINFGCIENFSPEIPFISSVPQDQKKRRQTIVVIGAGIAGLGCARQLDNLLLRYPEYFSDYEDLPRIIVLEGRRRIGGRIYSSPLKSDHGHMIDLGADCILGFGDGNPLAVLVRRQLGLPIIPVDRTSAMAEIYDGVTGEKVSEVTKSRMERLFNHIVSRMDQFKDGMQVPSTAKGDEVLMRAAKDPTMSGRDDSLESQTIGKLEEMGELPKAYEDPGALSDSGGKFGVGVNDPETAEEVEFMKSLGIKIQNEAHDSQERGHKHHIIHVAPEPAGEVYPSLGQTIDRMISQLQEFGELTDQQVRLLNWYLAQLEYKTGTNLDNLSLGSWQTDSVKNETDGTVHRYSVIQNGFISLIKGLYIYPDKLDVRFKTRVKVIEYDSNLSQVFLENGERIQADRVVVTAPLGVLKDRAIQFIPDLPQWKTDSIERLGYGMTNKVCLIYREAFWDESQDVICVSRGSESKDQEAYKAIRGDCYMFTNHTKAVGKPCLIGLVTGDAALEIANESDEDIIDAVCSVLAKIMPESKNSTLVESIITRWQVDPFSRGSYSYVGLEATGGDFNLLARPIGKSLFFAGEATCRDYPGTVHGAYVSGLRAANEVLNSLIGDIQIPHPLVPSKEQQQLQQQQQQQHVPALVNRSQQVHSAPPQSPTQANRYLYPNNNQNPGSGSIGPHYVQQRLIRSSLTSPLSQEFSSNDGYFDAEPRDRHQEGTRTTSKRRRKGSFEEKIEEIRNDPELSEIAEAEFRLRKLKDDRIAEDGERMRNDLIKELGERPIKPERPGANPFLIFQKDFWEICRQDTDKAKQSATGKPNERASRNEVRAALGKMWRELPDDEKEPYLEKTKSIKAENTKLLDQFREKSKRYDADAEDFRRRWKEEHASQPSEEELRIMRLLQKRTDEHRHRKKR